MNQKKLPNKKTANQGFILVAFIVVIVLIGARYLAYKHASTDRPLDQIAANDSADKKLSNTITEIDGKVIAKDASGKLLATFSRGARTVVLPGPPRTFIEPDATSATITTTDWIRLYPQPFIGAVDWEWLADAIADNQNNQPDVIAVSMQYVAGAPRIKDSKGLIIAGDASFGPGEDSDRQEGADFNDFIGIAIAYADKVDKPESGQLGSVDCSGYMRMVWGYRSGLPLELAPTGRAIPRRAFQILASAPGITLAGDAGKRLDSIPANLQSGDILFFNVDSNDGPQVDHLGMYLGKDSEGSYRFISSRKVANGPTFGDIAGRSVIDGEGLFATTLRAIRRF